MHSKMTKKLTIIWIGLGNVWDFHTKTNVFITDFLQFVLSSTNVRAIERHDRMECTPSDSRSKGSIFYSKLAPLNVVFCFLNPFNKDWGSTLKYCCSHFVPHYVHFIIWNSPALGRCITNSKAVKIFVK